MKNVIFLSAALLTITSCSQSKIDQYNEIIDRTSRIEINYKNLNKKLELDTKQVENFKRILKRNIDPTIQEKFIADIQIDLYDKEGRIGHLMITEFNSKPFVNFGSDDLNFGYPLTYGIGQYLNENK